MLNRIVLIGRLTRDPELRYTKNSGTAVCNFVVAVDRPFQKQGAEKETDFIRVVVWGKQGELVNEYMAKGRLVAVDGSLQIRTWTSQQGEKRQTPEVKADTVRFLDRAPSTSRGGGGGSSSGDNYEPDMTDYDDAPPAAQGPGRAEYAGGAAPQGSPPRPQSAGNKNYGKFSDEEIDEEIDLDDDPF
jgi:single-strand DNA-binding protein